MNLCRNAEDAWESSRVAVADTTVSDVSRVRNRARSTVVESTNPLLDCVLDCNGSYVVGTAASARTSEQNDACTCNGRLLA